MNCPTQYTSNRYKDYPQLCIDQINNFTITQGNIKTLRINPNSRMI